MRRRTRIVGKALVGLLGLAAAVLVAWAAAIGPRAVARILAHGTTTVWDHRIYPGRSLRPSPDPVRWPGAEQRLPPPEVELDPASVPLDTALARTGTLAFVLVRDGELVHEWYAPDHGPETPSMVFSVTKSVLSLLIGAAIDDGLIGSEDDPVTTYLPELAGAGFDRVRLEDLLRMDSSVDYVESDNPFGRHVEFNYTADLTADVLGLRVRGEPDPTFRYKSADYALLGLVLDRVLGERSVTAYLQERLWDPLGAEGAGTWSTDREGGLERTWCCLAVTAGDLARLGQLVLDGGRWRGRRIVTERWIRSSLRPGFEPRRWPAEYEGSPLANYGYGWWITREGARVALGKDGQYLYVDPGRETVLVRLGEGRGGHPWLATLARVAAAGRDSGALLPSDPPARGHGDAAGPDPRLAHHGSEGTR